MPVLARLGLFALCTLLVLFGFLYAVTNFGASHGAYRIGVHLANASGVPPGSQVFFSGVDVGSVRKVRILADNTVELILAIQRNIDIPKSSKFSVRPSLTGSPSIVITPPLPALFPGSSPTPLPRGDAMEKRVLPVSRQAVAVPPLSIEELMQQGVGVGNRALGMLRALQLAKPQMMQRMRHAQGTKAALQGSLVNLTQSLNARRNEVSDRLSRLKRDFNPGNQARLATLSASAQQTRAKLRHTASSARGVIANPALRDNLRQTGQNVQTAREQAAGLQGDVHNITGSPQTRAQLRDAAARVRAVMQELGSLLKRRAPAPSPGATHNPNHR